MPRSQGHLTRQDSQGLLSNRRFRGRAGSQAAITRSPDCCASRKESLEGGRGLPPPPAPGREDAIRVWGSGSCTPGFFFTAPCGDRGWLSGRTGLDLQGDGVEPSTCGCCAEPEFPSCPTTYEARALRPDVYFCWESTRGAQAPPAGLPLSLNESRAYEALTRFPARNRHH